MRNWEKDNMMNGYLVSMTMCHHSQNKKQLKGNKEQLWTEKDN